MISWIQNHLIRHGRWIFLSLLALIIVAFVFTIGNTPGCTTDRSGYQEQLYYGIDMNSPRERDALLEKVRLSAYLNGQQRLNNQQVENRIALLHLADEIGVPAPDQETLAEYITTKAAFRGEDGEFSADSYTAFVDQIESNPQTPQGLVLVVLEEDYRINQIGSVLAGPGYLLPSEALAQAQSNRTKYTLATAELSFIDFTPEIEPSEELLKEYYETNKLNYEIPERIRASYVLFELSRFEDQVPAASEEELREHFIANRAQFVAEYEANKPEPAEGEEVEDAPVTYAQVSEAVAKSFLSEQEARMANQAAQDFALSLYNGNIERDSAAFNELLNKNQVSLIKIEPYTATGLRQRALSPDMLESAFALGGNRYYSDPYQLANGFGVLIYQGRIAPEIPAFEDVKEEVSKNYVADEKRRLFNEKGESLKADLEAKLAEGTAFVEAAEALDLTAKAFETFSASDAPRELNRTAMQEAQGMQPGEISSMLSSGPSGIFVYLENKEVPEIAEDDEDLTQAQEMLKRYSTYTSGASYSTELVIQGFPEEDLETEE
jgi:peptidyl-prolyl cis-trans isomerase D